jgi:hypothetical protein
MRNRRKKTSGYGGASETATGNGKWETGNVRQDWRTGESITYFGIEPERFVELAVEEAEFRLVL